jgi:ATP-dependent Lon protease
VQAMLDSLSCDPCVIVDELDKSSQIGSQNGSVMGALLGMLDKPHEYHDTALMTKVDLSHIQFIATANALEPINGPLLDRFMIIPVPKPGLEHFDRILDQMRRDMTDRLGIPPGSLPLLDGDEYHALKSFFAGGRGSLRVVSDAYEIALRSALERQSKATPVLM